MAKVFLSFLGTNRYMECNYVIGDRRADNVRYIQEALISLFCSDFSSGDRVIIFLTPDAEKKNWKSRNGIKGLEETLSERIPDIRIIPTPIPEGTSEDEIWDIFQIMYDSLEHDDEVVYDITHGFRSLPVLGVTLLNYARYLKNIKVKGIYYGAFEALGTAKEVEEMPMEKRNAPVFNLTSFDNLMQWSMATDNFTNYGITEKLEKLVHDKVLPITRKLKVRVSMQ